MDRMVYLAMTGAKHALQAQQNTAHNLANANTTGFRADLDSLMSAPVTGPGHDSRVYSLETGVGNDFQQGSMQHTGRELDIAVEGKGWIAVQAADGTEGYTRRGDLKVGPGGLLETGDGRLVMGNDGPVAVPPAEKIEIGSDGTVSVVPLGQSADTLAVVDRIKLVNPPETELTKGEDGLFRLKQGGQAAPDGAVSVVNGTLEGSNVNTVDALVEMIDNQRQFEAYVKLMDAAKTNDEASSRLLRSS
ncbi:flagellar basal-body rod protein FlgF [Ectothiorhodospiraceae bacterium WFHF3C12]|nr:flagellar basal-body rod protein FlgF [Ectothiorhodospiraceae bacterium WFHF3C12]